MVAKKNLSMSGQEILEILKQIGFDIITKTSRLVTAENMQSIKLVVELFQKMAYTLIGDVLISSSDKELQKIAEKTIDILQKETEEIIELTLHNAITEFKSKG